MLEADFLIMTSLYEGTPNVVLEAMNIGLPAIISSSFSNSISFFHRKQNLVYKANNNQDLLNKIKDLASNDEEREMIGRNSKLYTKNYNKNSSQKWINFFERL